MRIISAYRLILASQWCNDCALCVVRSVAGIGSTKFRCTLGTEYQLFICVQDIVNRRTVELERGEDGLGIAIQVDSFYLYPQLQGQLSFTFVLIYAHMYVPQPHSDTPLQSDLSHAAGSVVGKTRNDCNLNLMRRQGCQVVCKTSFCSYIHYQ